MTEFNDVNEWHRITDRGAYERAGRQMVEIRACSASNGGMLTDKYLAKHKRLFDGFPKLFYCYPGGWMSPEENARYFLGTLANRIEPCDMVMLDIEQGSRIKPNFVAEFTRRWLVVVESVLNTKAWVYYPYYFATGGADKLQLEGVIGNRVKKCPAYSGSTKRGRAPWWTNWDVHQYTDRGWMPGSPDGPGDCNFSNLSVVQLQARCRITNGPSPIPVFKTGESQQLLLF